MKNAQNAIVSTAVRTGIKGCKSNFNVYFGIKGYNLINDTNLHIVLCKVAVTLTITLNNQHKKLAFGDKIEQ